MRSVEQALKHFGTCRGETSLVSEQGEDQGARDCNRALVEIFNRLSFGNAATQSLSSENKPLVLHRLRTFSFGHPSLSLNFTINAGLSHKIYTFCFAQSLDSSHSSMSKYQSIRAIIERISA